jgi:hypothetical protein
MLAEDEAQYGSSYDADGRWVENTLLTQAQRAAADQARAALSVKPTDRESATKLRKAETKVESSVVRYPNSESWVCVGAEYCRSYLRTLTFSSVATKSPVQRQQHSNDHGYGNRTSHG